MNQLAEGMEVPGLEPHRSCLSTEEVVNRYQLLFPSCCCPCAIAKPCPSLCDHMGCSTPGFPVLHYFLEFVFPFQVKLFLRFNYCRQKVTPVSGTQATMLGGVRVSTGDGEYVYLKQLTGLLSTLRGTHRRHACEYGQGLSPGPQKSSCQRPSVTCEQRTWICLRFCKALVGADIGAVLSWSLLARQDEKCTTSPESERNVDPCCYLFYIYTSVYLLEYCCWTPWTAARRASLSFTISQSLLKLMSI